MVSCVLFRKVGIDLKDIPADVVTIDATDKLVMPGNTLWDGCERERDRQALTLN